jgi:hypothetical protein
MLSIFLTEYCYLFFFKKAPIFGVAIVKICDAAGFNKNGFFGVALGMYVFIPVQN